MSRSKVKVNRDKKNALYTHNTPAVWTEWNALVAHNRRANSRRDHSIAAEGCLRRDACDGPGGLYPLGCATHFYSLFVVSFSLVFFCLWFSTVDDAGIRQRFTVYHKCVVSSRLSYRAVLEPELTTGQWVMVKWVSKSELVTWVTWVMHGSVSLTHDPLTDD